MMHMERRACPVWKRRTPHKGSLILPAPIRASAGRRQVHNPRQDRSCRTR